MQQIVKNTTSNHKCAIIFFQVILFDRINIPILRENLQVKSSGMILALK